VNIEHASRPINEILTLTPRSFMSSTSKLTTSNGSRNCGISDELQTQTSSARHDEPRPLYLSTFARWHCQSFADFRPSYLCFGPIWPKFSGTISELLPIYPGSFITIAVGPHRTATDRIGLELSTWTSKLPASWVGCGQNPALWVG